MYVAGDKEAKAAEKAILSMDYFRYGKGKEVHAAEREWSAKIGCRDAVMLTSGTAALEVCLKALHIGPGDSVLIPAYTYVATPLAVTSVGAIPIYVEVDAQLTLDVEDLKRKIRKHSKAVIPVHMAGMPCNMQEVMKVAKQHQLAVIEDCAQAAGGSYRGKRLGSIGDLSAFSFNEYKIISCGEGGCCGINRKKYIKTARSASDGGLYAWNEGKALGEQTFCTSHHRFNNINAAILRQQILRLDGILTKLRRTRRRLLESLRLPEDCGFTVSHDEEGNCGVCFLVSAPTEERAKQLNILINRHLPAYRPIDSGRHIYKDWDVINRKRGGHHPDWDCFRHPRNQKIKTNYDRQLKQSDRFLSRTVLVRVPFGKRAPELNQLIRDLNREFVRI